MEWKGVEKRGREEAGTRGRKVVYIKGIGN